jgi:ribulose 1,5-bisphosphate synthetase/thiazole synthase
MVNWEQLQGIFLKRGMLMIPKKLVDATMHNKPGAAEAMVQLMYAFLENANLSITLPKDCEFTDAEYQQAIPAHARATLSMAIKNNMRSLEMISDPDLIRQENKVKKVMKDFNTTQMDMRSTDPGRFNKMVVDATGHTHKPTQLAGKETAPPITHTTLYTTKRLEGVTLGARASGPVGVQTKKVARNTAK